MTLTITQHTIGVLAVMFIGAIVGGRLTYAVTGILLLGGVTKGGRFYDTIAILRYPLTFLGAVAGGYLGYLLMS